MKTAYGENDLIIVGQDDDNQKKIAVHYKKTGFTVTLPWDFFDHDIVMEECNGPLSEVVMMTFENIGRMFAKDA